MNSEDPYAYPGSSVLRNRLGILDPEELDVVERRLVYEPMTSEISRIILNAAPVCFVIHSLVHLRAALTAASSLGDPVIALSAPGASAYAGAAWFAALVRQGEAEFPNVPFIAILDCGDRAGDVLSALGTGLKHLVFTGHPEALRRLKAIAAESGAEILDRRPEAFDLVNRRAPERAARAWCQASSE